MPKALSGIGLSLLFFVFPFFFCSGDKETGKPTILVSVAPHKFFAEKIAADTLSIHLMVPAGASAHTYEPGARQILLASRGKIWFRIGEPFEERAIRALESYKPSPIIIDMRRGLDLIRHSHGHKGCCGGSEDLHFWLSARQAKIQAATIADSLIENFPEHADLYRKNLHTFQAELEELDKEIGLILSRKKIPFVLVSHPAYAYFCRDYGLEQLSIETEGKDPTPGQMTRLLNEIRRLDIRTIYIQMQYNNKAAKLVAETTGAQLVVLDPYSEEYLRSMKEIANAFANG